jgi:hypothetical protein
MKKALLLALLAAASAALAEPPPQQIDIHNLRNGATVVDQVVIPVPTEIFGVLDKLGHPVWHDVLRPVGKVKTPSSQEQIALLLGTVVAEGFVAVEAEDTEAVKDIGKAVLTLSGALGVSKVVVQRSSAIMDAADKKQWPHVRGELDHAQRDVEDAMKQLGDEDLSQLVSLGGWLRGTEALTQVIQQHFSKDAAELLHQPALLEHFLKRIDHFKPRIKSNPLVIQMKEGLEKLAPFMGNEETPITEKTVDEINKIVQRLNAAIHPKNP